MFSFLLVLTSLFFVLGSIQLVITLLREIEFAKYVLNYNKSYDGDYFKENTTRYVTTVLLIIGFIFSGNQLLVQNEIENKIQQEECDKRYKEFYTLGMKAAESGIASSACPYKSYGNRNYILNERAWLEGWIAKTNEINKTKTQSKGDF